MKAQIILFLSTILLLSSCKHRKYYSIDNFDDVTKSHKTIAILPPEMVEQIQEIESKAFQVSLHNQLLKSTRRGKDQLRISLQHYKTTMSKLEENNISIADSWNESPQVIAEILGVDAVVISRVEKEKYFSDLLSAGIDIGGSIIDILAPGSGRPFVSSRNKSVKSDVSIIDSIEGKTLWSINYTCEANWNQQSDQVVDFINRRSAKFFPYRAN